MRDRIIFIFGCKPQHPAPEKLSETVGFFLHLQDVSEEDGDSSELDEEEDTEEGEEDSEDDEEEEEEMCLPGMDGKEEVCRRSSCHCITNKNQNYSLKDLLRTCLMAV